MFAKHDEQVKLICILTFHKRHMCNYVKHESTIESFYSTLCLESIERRIVIYAHPSAEPFPRIVLSILAAKTNNSANWCAKQS